MTEDNISSEFTPEYDDSDRFPYRRRLPEIRDFSRLERLESEGSTCVCYRWEHSCRVYFVKRLKQQFLGSAQHIHAFEKEFELGSRLSHPSLPNYVDFVYNYRECYIVMDFIDGKTLKEFRHSTEIISRKTIYNVIHQLIEVIDYLHRHNVLHYDLIPENVMLTNGLNNIVLLDLDKSFNSAFTKTSGDTSRFGVADHNQPSLEVDYRAIANIIRSFVHDHAELESLMELCNKPDILPVDLLEALRTKYNDVIVTNHLFTNGVTCDAYIGYLRLETFAVKKLKPHLLGNKDIRDGLIREYEQMSKFGYGPQYTLLQDTPQECFILIEKPYQTSLSELLKNKPEWFKDRHTVGQLLNAIWEQFMALYRKGLDNVCYSTEDIFLDTNSHSYRSFIDRVWMVNLREVLDVSITEEEPLISGKNSNSGRYERDKSNEIKLPGLCTIIDAMRDAGVDMDGVEDFYQACLEGSSVREMWGLMEKFHLGEPIYMPLSFTPAHSAPSVQDPPSRVPSE